MPPPHEDDLAAPISAGRKIQYLSVAWTICEAGLALCAGWLANSFALIGFGADSLIEILSSLAVLWRLYARGNGEERERTALRLVGLCFLALAGYVGWEAVESLVTRRIPSVTYFGIGVTILSMVMMTLLAQAKRRVARQMHSASLAADSKQSSICVYLSAIVLAGLALNALFHWWWADPVAALCMLPIIVREGVGAVRGQACCHDHAH
jgi:divalent metal cation (Fe/Co/Zn/Cd) transporter